VMMFLQVARIAGVVVRPVVYYATSKSSHASRVVHKGPNDVDNIAQRLQALVTTFRLDPRRRVMDPVFRRERKRTLNTQVSRGSPSPLDGRHRLPGAGTAVKIRYLTPSRDLMGFATLSIHTYAPGPNKVTTVENQW